ncbi:Crp/Fnr family transcriptional regulator [Microvirga aerophila]|uniref:Crp/Fnr family transcriptional regulator n=1 Tax=Microvirga aerophila TaxID=670291 RepID=A0A512C1Q9_9HYPH|nr:Crp/Fnr family transcriptional regulator [Microvirga aerophila]GEO18119.1 Crp/Fnr family transcriptional regulator [Microvirga aerophila]
MANPLIRKLQQVIRLSADDQRLLEQATSERVTRFGQREDLMSEGDEPREIHPILSGWACRYKQLEDGRRAVLAFLLPGDLCDPSPLVLGEMDHSVGTLTSGTLAAIPRAVFEELTFHHPRVAQALWREALVQAAIQREWTLSLGQRNAYERLCHLLCELFLRLRIVGLTQGPSCELPVTQAKLAEATGLTGVHLNRMLQELRAANLVVLKGKTLTIPDLPALMAVALFSPNYLHLTREGSAGESHEAAAHRVSNHRSDSAHPGGR